MQLSIAALKSVPIKPLPTPRVPVIREIRIEKIAPGGQGLAFVEDAGERRAIFVPLAAPGDLVRVEIDFAQKPARGTLLTVVEAGAARVAPACAVAARCGGCDFMHLGHEAQAAAHEAMLRESLPASLRGLPVAVHAAGASVSYRTRARVHLRFGKRNEVGFLGARSHDVVEAPRCLVLVPALEALRSRLPTWLAGAKGKGQARLALGAFPSRSPVVDFTFAGELPPTFFAALERAVANGELAGARVLEEGATRHASFGDPSPWMLGADGAPIRLAAGGFGQASDEGNALLGARVMKLASPLLDADVASGKLGAAPVVELFSGAGNFTVALAAHTSKLVAIESDLAACEAARDNLAVRGLKAKVTNADASKLPLARGLRLVVLDPPRTGAREACIAIVASRAQHVLYVSCDPPTLGRDLAILEAGGYSPRSIDLFELFPQTSHVETVVLLSRTPL